MFPLFSTFWEISLIIFSKLYLFSFNKEIASLWVCVYMFSLLLYSQWLNSACHTVEAEKQRFDWLSSWMLPPIFNFVNFFFIAFYFCFPNIISALVFMIILLRDDLEFSQKTLYCLFFLCSVYFGLFLSYWKLSSYIWWSLAFQLVRHKMLCVLGQAQVLGCSVGCVTVTFIGEAWLVTICRSFFLRIIFNFNCSKI